MVIYFSSKLEHFIATRALIYIWYEAALRLLQSFFSRASGGFSVTGTPGWKRLAFFYYLCNCAYSNLSATLDQVGLNFPAICQRSFGRQPTKRKINAVGSASGTRKGWIDLGQRRTCTELHWRKWSYALCQSKWTTPNNNKTNVSRWIKQGVWISTPWIKAGKT